MWTSISHTPLSQQAASKKHIHSDMAANRPFWHLRPSSHPPQNIITLDSFLSRLFRKRLSSKLALSCNQRVIQLRLRMDNLVITISTRTTLSWIKTHLG
jgi:hypothetical protein